MLQNHRKIHGFFRFGTLQAEPKIVKKRTQDRSGSTLFQAFSTSAAIHNDTHKMSQNHCKIHGFFVSGTLQAEPEIVKKRVQDRSGSTCFQRFSTSAAIHENNL